MGRGSGHKQVLPLSELSFRSPENLLQLAFAPGSVLELRWDSSEATLVLNKHPRLALLDFRGTMTRTALTHWLDNVENAPYAPKGSVTIGPFDLVWNPGDDGPSLFIRSVAENRLAIGKVTWDALRDFLQDAHSEALF